jgi:hypothetical protein
MKKLLAILLAAASLGALVPTQADAWDGRHSHRRITGHYSCGRPIYSTYEICGHDAWGRPIGRWISNYQACACHVCRPPVRYGPPVHHHHGHHHGHNHHRGYRSTSGFFFSFGR